VGLFAEGGVRVVPPCGMPVCWWCALCRRRLLSLLAWWLCTVVVHATAPPVSPLSPSQPQPTLLCLASLRSCCLLVRAGAKWALPVTATVSWVVYPGLTPAFKHSLLPFVFPDPEAKPASE
jgi:hypothetical protein